MAEFGSIARPYARAVFELAQRQGDLPGWGARLETLAAIAADADVVALAGNPRIATAQLQALILEVASEIAAQPADKPVGKTAANAASPEQTQQMANLLKLLAQNRRLAALPAVARAYAALRAASENSIAANLTTAVALDCKQQTQFVEALQSKLGRRVELTFAVDADLIGGAIVRAGDWVVDGSVRGQLEQLGAAIAA